MYCAFHIPAPKLPSASSFPKSSSSLWMTLSDGERYVLLFFPAFSYSYSVYTLKSALSSKTDRFIAFGAGTESIRHRPGTATPEAEADRNTGIWQCNHVFLWSGSA
jgi:hypothetical protein